MELLLLPLEETEAQRGSVTSPDRSASDGEVRPPRASSHCPLLHDTGQALNLSEPGIGLSCSACSSCLPMGKGIWICSEIYLGSVLFYSGSMTEDGIGKTCDEVHFKNKALRLYLSKYTENLRKYTELSIVSRYTINKTMNRS